MYSITIKIPTKKAIATDILPVLEKIGGKLILANKIAKPPKKTKKKTDLEQALEEYDNANFIHCGSIEEFSKKIDKYFK